MTESEIYDEVVARLGESESLQEFRHSVQPFVKTIISSDQFPKTKNNLNDNEKFNAITTEMWCECWLRYS